ncbi:hypothetical protein FBUS_04417, partial [Fasciolopsis buskii]
ANRSHFHSSAYNADGSPVPYAASFLGPQNGSISATSSESSLASGLSEVNSINTAASGNGTWRRFGVPLEPSTPYGGRSERWNDPQTIVDDIPLHGRRYTSLWSCLNYRENGAYFDPAVPSQVVDENSPSNPDSDSPLFYSLASIQTTGCSTVCPSCRCNVSNNTTPTNHSSENTQSSVQICTCSSYQHNVQPITSPSCRFGAYLDQQTPTKLTRTPSATHAPFPSLVLTRLGSSEHSAMYYEHREHSSPNSRSVTADPDLIGLGSPSPSTSGLEVSGDIRAVNLISHDQLPFRTWV